MQKAGIQLSSEKCKIAIEVEFCGLQITDKAIKPYERKLEAIFNAKRPDSLTVLRSFNDETDEFPAQKRCRMELDAGDGNRLQQSQGHDEGGNDRAPVQQKHDDLYRWQLALIQENPENGERHLIQAGSGSLTDNETRYETISIELLAVLSILGLPVTVN